MTEDKETTGEHAEIWRKLDELLEKAKQKDGSQKPEDQKALNSLFEAIPVSMLPPSHLGRVLDVASDASLEEAIRMLAAHGILSAPVRDAKAPADASWIDRYLGLVDFPAVVLWVLNHKEVGVLDPSAAAAGTPEKATAAEDLFALVQSTAELKETKVSDVAGTFRWAPFLPLTRDDSMLTLLLMLSVYRARAVPIVEMGQGVLGNVVTQTSVLGLLHALCRHPAFQPWAQQSLADLGLPRVKGEALVRVSDTDAVLEPFRLMQALGIGGVPVVARGTKRVVGSMSVRDIQVLLLHPSLLQNHRMLTVRDFMRMARHSVPGQSPTAVQKPALTVSEGDSVASTLQHMHREHTLRAYVRDASGDLSGVVTLRDIISRMVQEPKGYFGDFFQGVVPVVRTASS